MPPGIQITGNGERSDRALAYSIPARFRSNHSAVSRPMSGVNHHQLYHSTVSLSMTLPWLIGARSGMSWSMFSSRR